jgi:sarcosine oxidase
MRAGLEDAATIGCACEVATIGRIVHDTVSVVSATSATTVVIGGGIVGLCAAWHIGRLGGGPVTLLERFKIGHDRGSSHGSARITRTAYGREVFVRLMRRVHEEEWPRLEREAGRPLVTKRDGLFFGPDAAEVARWGQAIARAGVGDGVVRLARDEARRRFPAFRFDRDCDEILWDRTSGVIAAADAIRSLHALLVRAGCDVREETRVLSIDRARDPLELRTDRGTIHAARLVIAAGAWVRDLAPEVAGRVRVARQAVCYARLPRPADELPVWVRLIGGENGVVYALPEVGHDALKIARHVTAGRDDDPDHPAGTMADAVEDMRVQLDETLAPALARSARIIGVDRCLYTNTPDESFIVELASGDPRIAIGSACSGHGFKLAPLTGLALAELVIRGRTEVDYSDPPKSGSSSRRIM